MSGGHPVIQKTCHYFPCHTLRHLSTHPNYPACNLKGFSRSVLDVLISRTHPLPFNRRGKRGNEWCRACQASWERHGRASARLTLLPRVGFIRAEAVGQSTPKLTGKDWEEPSMAAANPVSRFSSPAWLKGAFQVSLGEFSPTRPKMANPWLIARLLRWYLADITDGIFKKQNVFLHFSQSVRAKVRPGFSQGGWPYPKQSTFVPIAVTVPTPSELPHHLHKNRHKATFTWQNLRPRLANNNLSEVWIFSLHLFHWCHRGYLHLVHFLCVCWTKTNTKTLSAYRQPSERPRPLLQL